MADKEPIVHHLPPVAWRWRYLYEGRTPQWTVCQTPRSSCPAEPGFVGVGAEPLFPESAIQSLEQEKAELQSDLDDLREQIKASADALAEFEDRAYKAERQIEVAREALTASRDKFVEYVRLHRAKLSADTPSSDWLDIQQKVRRNQEMVDVLDQALLDISSGQD